MNDACHDLIGYRLENAMAYCKKHGLTADVFVTRPMRGNVSSARLRVVRYKFVSSSEVEFTAVFESTEKGGCDECPTK